MERGGLKGFSQVTGPRTCTSMRATSAATQTPVSTSFSRGCSWHLREDIHGRACTHTHTHRDTHRHAYRHRDTHRQINKDTHTDTEIHTHTHTHTHRHAHRHRDTHTQINTDTHTDTEIHTHTHTHTHHRHRHAHRDTQTTALPDPRLRNSNLRGVQAEWKNTSLEPHQLSLPVHWCDSGITCQCLAPTSVLTPGRPPPPVRLAASVREGDRHGTPGSTLPKVRGLSLGPSAL